MTTKIRKIVSRRNLLAGVAAGGAAAAALAVPALPLSWTRAGKGRASWWDRAFLSLERGGYSDWSKLVGSTFSLNGAALTLVAVKPFENRGRRPATLSRDRAFAAVFEPKSGSAPANDGTYPVNHSDFGAMKIFMTAATGATTRMEAVFN